MNEVMRENMKKDPWHKMAIEAQFRQADPDTPKDIPATLQYLVENEHKINTNSGPFERGLNLLQRAHDRGDYARTLSLMIWGEGTPLDAAMNYKLGSLENLLVEVATYGNQM